MENVEPDDLALTAARAFSVSTFPFASTRLDAVGGAGCRVFGGSLCLSSLTSRSLVAVSSKMLLLLFGSFSLLVAIGVDGDGAEGGEPVCRFFARSKAIES